MRMNLNETRIYEGKTIYGWQLLWSKLLNIGIIINPPIEAEVLFDYISGGVNKKGITIKESVHSKGLAFDISGGEDHDPSNELARVKQALEAKLPGLKGYTLERKNNCLHVDCEEPGKRVTLTVGGVEHTLLEV